MGDTMKQLYNKMTLLHEVMTPMVKIQNKSQEILKFLKITKKAIDLMQNWDTNNLNVLDWLIKKYIFSSKVMLS